MKHIQLGEHLRGAGNTRAHLLTQRAVATFITARILTIIEGDLWLPVRTIGHSGEIKIDQ